MSGTEDRDDLESLKAQRELVRRIRNSLQEAYALTPVAQADEKETLKIKIELREAELRELDKRIERFGQAENRWLAPRRRWQQYLYPPVRLEAEPQPGAEVGYQP